MHLIIESAFIFLFIPHLAHSQIDEYRRQRNPFEFYQIGPESPPKARHHLYLEDRLNSVPPLGSSEYVRYFARQTSGENLNNLLNVTQSNYKTDGTINVRRGVTLIDNEDNKDPHSSHRNFVQAGFNKYYSVRTPDKLEPQAPIVGNYHSSYQERNKGGKLYLGNRPFYF